VSGPRETDRASLREAIAEGYFIGNKTNEEQRVCSNDVQEVFSARSNAGSNGVHGVQIFRGKQRIYIVNFN
jgi:hypothetical protein